MTIYLQQNHIVERANKQHDEANQGDIHKTRGQLREEGGNQMSILLHIY